MVISIEIIFAFQLIFLTFICKLKLDIFRIQGTNKNLKYLTFFIPFNLQFSLSLQRNADLCPGQIQPLNEISIFDMLRVVLLNKAARKLQFYHSVLKQHACTDNRTCGESAHFGPLSKDIVTFITEFNTLSTNKKIFLKMYSGVQLIRWN